MGRSKAVLRPVWPCFEQEFESLVGLARRAEAGELPHGPEPAAIHGGMHAARERDTARDSRGRVSGSKPLSVSGV